MSGADYAARAIALDGLAKLASTEAAKGGMLVGHRGSDAQSVGRRVAEKLDDVISVRDFGAKGDGVTDDTVAIRNAVRALKSRCASFSGYRQGTGCLYFPEGVYRITEGGLLSGLNATPSKRSGMIVRGAGWRNSILWLDPSALTADAWFYDNGADSTQWGMICEDICFAGGATWQEADPANEAGYGYATVNSFSKGFKLTGPGWESGFVFNRCQFRFLETVFHVAGGNNADTHRFIACEVSKCINGNYIDNPQVFSVNWIGCYVDQIYGNFLTFGPNANGGGGNFAMIGGALIAVNGSGDTAVRHVVHAVNGGPSLANAPITFSDVRFELRGNYHGIANASFGSTILTFRDCSFFNTGTADKNGVTVGGYCTVRLNGGSIANGSGGGRFKFVIGGASDGRRGKNAWLHFTGGCVVPTAVTSASPATDALFVGNGGRLTVDETCSSETFTDPTADPRAFAFACDTFGPATIIGGGLAQSTRHRTRKRFTISPFFSNTQMVGSGGLAGVSVQLPLYSRIIEVWAKIEPGQGNTSPIRCLIGSDDKSVIYAQSIVGPQATGQFVVARDLYIPVEITLNKRRIRFWFDDGAGGQTVASSTGRVDGGVVYE